MKNAPSYLKFCGVLTLVVSGALSMPAAIIFSEDFEGAALGSDASLTETVSTTGTGGSAAYTVQTEGAGQDYQALIGVSPAAANSSAVAAATTSTSALSAVNLGTDSFSMSTTFTVDAFASGTSSGTINIGLGAFGSVNTFSSGNYYRLVYQLTSTSNVGNLILSDVSGTTVNSQNVSTGTLTPVNGLSGTLTLNGRYTGGSLVLNGILQSGVTTLTATLTDSTPLPGTFFGYRTALATGATSGTVSENVDYDNFNITTVPEPTSMGLILGSAVLALGLRRVRRRK